MYNAFITTLKNVRKHTNADRLLCGECFGNTVIVDLSYTEGQKVIYFPVDGQLSQEFAEKHNLVRKKDENGNNIGGYLDPGKRNITALKLRGERSDGLVLPIESLADYCDISTLSEGQMITVLNGKEICCKYVPPVKPVRNGPGNNVKKKDKTPKIKYPYFAEHIDTEQLAYNLSRFKKGDTCYITLKMHGTSARSSYAYSTQRIKQNFLQRLFKCKPKYKNGYEYVSGSRRVTLGNFEGGYYGDNKFREKWHDFFKGKLYEGEEIFYEIVGYTGPNSPIMGDGDNKKVDKAMGDKEFSKKYGPTTRFSYGCEDGENDIYVYRMTITTSQGVTVEYPWELVKRRCEEIGVKHVIEFDKFLYTTEKNLMQRVEKFYDGEDPVGKTHIREGVVIRIDNRPKFTAFKHKNFNFKVLENIIKADATQADIEEAQEFIITESEEQ